VAAVGRGNSAMRVAAVYDIHGNLPAPEAVLQEICQAGVDQIVVGGDVLPGPMPYETLTCLRDLGIRPGRPRRVPDGILRTAPTTSLVPTFGGCAGRACRTALEFLAAA